MMLIQNFPSSDILELAQHPFRMTNSVYMDTMVDTELQYML